MIFRGTFEHALDAKNRLTVPAKFRGALAGGVVLAASPETAAGAPRSVAIWTPDAYETFTGAALAGLNPLLAQGARAAALLLQLLRMTPNSTQPTA